MGGKIEASPTVDNEGNKLGCQISEGQKGVGDDILVEGQGHSEDGMPKIAEDLNGSDGTGFVPSSFQGNQLNAPPLLPPPPPSPPPPPPPPSFSQLQQPPTGPVVRWERFLPLRSLKVLLVENDDSTRHVVSALLRNCSYEVTTSANGLEAWKILEDLNNHVDLVLTEVAMPGLSGIGLLCKIMSHWTYKNIPVIMMSSHDSMGMVFKCLSKGAVDFLVKPIRKNELKNLWQHVWRRCHSSSGSGSESGIQAHKSMSGDESDNNSGSNDKDVDSSIGLNMWDRSDNGSGTQSSWTKRAAEVESPWPASQQDHWLADPPDSTCAQVIHPKSETICNEWMPISGSKGCQEQEFLDNESMGKDLEIGEPKDAGTQVECFPSEKVHPSITSSSLEFATEETAKTNQQPSLLEKESVKVTRETSLQAADLIGAIANTINSQIPSRSSKVPNDRPKILANKDRAVNDAMDLPPFELSLKRLISGRDGATATSNDRNILRHSDQSAFSRYNSSMASNKAPTALGGTNDSSNHINMGSTILNALSRPVPLTEKSETALVVKGTRRSAFHPVQLRASATEEVVQERADDIETSATVVQPKGIRVQVEHHHHHYHHHHIHGLQHHPQLQHPGDQEQYTLKNLASAVPQCGSSNVFGGPMEFNAANYSVNGSLSGSNHGSNILNGSSAAANTVGINTENSGAAGKSGGEDNNVIGGQSGSAVDHNRIAQREAALSKFRQKRKDRCFEKKVRYQSRKKLAEQRPRLRGQFVRQTTLYQGDQDADC